MRYFGMPMGMWVLFGKSFHDHLVSVLGYSQKEADRITAAAKPKYHVLRISSQYEKEAGSGTADRVLRPFHDDKPYEMVLPDERQEKVQQKRCPGDERNGKDESRGTESLFLEYGLSALS